MVAREGIVLPLLQDEHNPSENGRKTSFSCVPKESSLRTKLFTYAAALISTVVFTLGTASAQLLDGHIPDFELNLWRSGAQFLLTLIGMLKKRDDVYVPREKWLHLAGVIFVIVLANLTLYTSAKMLPVGTLFGIDMAVILITNMAASICMKQERSIMLYLPAGISIMGILLLTQPEVMFSGLALYRAPTPNRTSLCLDLSEVESHKNVTLQKETSRNEHPIIGYILIIIAGIGYSTYCHLVKSLTNTVTSLKVSFYVGIFGTILSLIPMVILESPILPRGLCLLFLIIHAIGASQVSVVIIFIMKYISPTMWTLFVMLSQPIFMVYQYTWLKPFHPGHGNWVEILGATICFMCGISAPVWDLLKEARKKNILNGQHEVIDN